MSRRVFNPCATVQEMSDTEIRDRLSRMNEVWTVVKQYRNAIIEVGDSFVVVRSDHPQGDEQKDRHVTFDEIRDAETSPRGDNGRVKQALHNALRLDVEEST